MSDLFQEQLQALRGQSLHRKLREIGTAQGAEVKIVGEELINFSSSDYLGLANDPILREAAKAAINEFGVGAGATRLMTGTQSPHVRLETAPARWKEAPVALAFSSGYAAALGTLPALVGEQDVIILDRLSHAALVDAAKLSGATIRVFPHHHLGKLESHLDWARHERPGGRVLIVTESVSSGDGDRAPLRAIVGLKKRFGAMLLLNEANADGVIGLNGRGLAAEENLAREIEVRMGTFGKALGVSGGYVCGSRSLIDCLISLARSFIYSTALPPAMAAAATAAVDFLHSPSGEQRRISLWQRIGLLRRFMNERGLSLPKTPEDGSAIHRILVGDEEAALEQARLLRSEGLLVSAIRYPVVPRGVARLRVTITAAHTEPQIRKLADMLGRLHADLNLAA